jgi:hypothetical protein
MVDMLRARRIVAAKVRRRLVISGLALVELLMS